jgi:multiple sugar transport system ATP-binding protein
MAVIELDHISKRFDNGTEAVKDTSFEIADGEFLVLVGPSGCGKSTVLRMIAGLETLSGGEIRIDGKRINELPPKDRDIAMVFQSYALYPHMTVAENIAFALRLHRVPNDEIDRRVRETAELLELDTLLDRKPKQLSGGQRQRVAMGRAIVREPKVFLMDEPLSNLDAKLRVQMRSDIAEIQDRLAVTTVYVTHDQIEAMTMADRVAVMRKGAMQQIDAPQTIYEQPANLFVAAFIGSPPMNLMEGHVRREDRGAVVVLGDQNLLLEPSVLDIHPRLQSIIDTDAMVAVGIRPEDLEDSVLFPSNREQQLEVKIDRVASLGAEVEVHFGLDCREIATEEARLPKGETVESRRLRDPHVTCVGTLNPRTKVRPGETVLLSVDTMRMHFFDPATGLRL